MAGPRAAAGKERRFDMFTKPAKEAYDRLAASYDRRWAVYIGRTAAETLKRVDARPGARLLDVGCGTGTLLALVERELPTLERVGVDLSAAMLRVARGKVAAGTALIQADAASLPFPPDSFDIVVSASAFHYWPDPAGVLRELHRVLRPSGRLVLTDWCDDYLACKLCDRWLRWNDPAHVRTYTMRQCREFTVAAGFEPIGIDRYKISWLWGLMTAVAARNSVSNQWA